MAEDSGGAVGHGGDQIGLKILAEDHPAEDDRSRSSPQEENERAAVAVAVFTFRRI